MRQCGGTQEESYRKFRPHISIYGRFWYSPGCCHALRSTAKAHSPSPVILSRPCEHPADLRWACDREFENMAFDFQPTMKGPLVELRPLRPDDADDLFAVASDPLIWEQHPVRDRYKPDVFSAFFRESLASRGALTALDRKMAELLDRPDSTPTAHSRAKWKSGGRSWRERTGAASTTER